MKLIYKNKRKTHSKHANEAVDKARQRLSAMGDAVARYGIGTMWLSTDGVISLERSAAQKAIESSPAYQKAYQAAQAGGMGNDESHEFALEHATSKVDQNTGATFISNMEPGAIFNSLRILGNFRRKKDAEGFISQSFNTAIEGYCNGKYSRGWVVYTAADTTERNGR